MGHVANDNGRNRNSGTHNKSLSGGLGWGTKLN